MGFHLWKFEISVVRVHLFDLLSGWGAEDFDDLDQLIDTAVARKDGLTEHQFSQHTTSRPNV